MYNRLKIVGTNLIVYRKKVTTEPYMKNNKFKTRPCTHVTITCVYLFILYMYYKIGHM